ncbi:MAG: sn-glycerol-1-phosphate dehydrogenase [Clostridia bacterium]|nr:sn-glycerol-1-phosphate dehydrogenase [Clostridia bacterium]
MIMEQLLKMNGAPCACGRKHEFRSEILSGQGVIRSLPDVIRQYGAKKPYLLSDINTDRAAGSLVRDLLEEAGIAYAQFCFPELWLEPDERTVGAALMHLPKDCDMIIAIGSGVINDTAKMISVHTKLPYVIVATAPSMDGYASMTSSMTMEGLKISLPSRCADVIIGDVDLLASAPRKMLVAGVGDMLAKYVSICEWRIAALVCGEYYCENIATLIRTAVRKIVESADGLLEGDPSAVSAVFDGLSAGSVAMNYAGLSRPASGTEHYFSHVWDMRGAEFGDTVELHGIQCAIGTLLSLRLYDKLKGVTPDRERALAFAERFDVEAWNERLRVLLGKSAESMIALEKKEGKYDVSKHHARLEVILTHWEEIQAIIAEELPSAEFVESLMKKLGLPTDVREIGIDPTNLGEVFRATKDIRDKYVLSRLLWDLGIIDEFAESLT